MKWFFERLAAGIAVSGLTGVIVAIAFTVFSVVAERGLSGDNAGAFLAGVGGISFIGLIWGAAFGTIPATLVICLSNARYRPWKSVLPLVIGASAGCAVGLLLAQYQPFVRLDGYWVWTIFATLGGVSAALLLKKPATAA